MLHSEIMAHFMSNNKSGSKTNVFIDVAAALHVTHALYTGQTQRAAWAIVTGAEVMTKLK